MGAGVNHVSTKRTSRPVNWPMPKTSWKSRRGHAWERTNIKPRCSTHNKTMRWLPYRHRWACKVLRCPEVALDDAPQRYKKPKPVRTVYDAGREVLYGLAWRARKQEVWLFDEKQCVKCHRMLGQPDGRMGCAEIHHIHGRGTHGSKRQDQIFVNGERNLETLCWACHAKAKIKRRKTR